MALWNITSSDSSKPDKHGPATFQVTGGDGGGGSGIIYPGEFVATEPIGAGYTTQTGTITIPETDDERMEQLRRQLGIVPDDDEPEDPEELETSVHPDFQ